MTVRSFIVYHIVKKISIGKIKIGNNVLIAPNAYVNFNVPDNSVVVGNPAQITPKDNATEDYINKKIEY